MIKGLPKLLTKHFQVMILADTAFGSIEFLHGIRKLKYHAITGLSINRKLVDGRILRKIQKINCPTVGVALSSDTTTRLGFARKFCETVGQFITCKSLRHLHKQGQQVNLVGLKFPVTVAWYYLKRENGRVEKRFVLSTKPLKASTIKWWGKRRWQIEGWFKTAKHRFGLHRFGQSSLLGMYRWLILSFLAYFIVHWTYLSTQLPLPPDWGEAAQTALESFFCSQVVSLLLLDINRLTLLARSCGFDIQIFRCKM